MRYLDTYVLAAIAAPRSRRARPRSWVRLAWVRPWLHNGRRGLQGFGSGSVLITHGLATVNAQTPTRRRPRAS